MTVYRCSSDKKSELYSSLPQFSPTWFYAGENVRRSNYLLAAGATTDSYGDYGTLSVYLDTMPDGTQVAIRGMFGNNGAAEFSEVLDGLSNSIAIGESVQDHSHRVFGPFWGAGVATCCHGFVATQDIRLAGEMTSSHINGFWQGGVDPLTGQCSRGAWNRCVFASVFSSYHPGGAQFVMGDGSVKFLSETMNKETFRLMNYIDDGKPLEFEN